MDMVQMLANAVNELAGLGVRLVLTIASVGGIAMVILYLSGVAGRSRRGQYTDSGGTFLAVLLLACCVIALESVVNAGGNQLGFGSVSFAAIDYVPDTRYGPAAAAVHAAFDALRTLT